MHSHAKRLIVFLALKWLGHQKKSFKSRTEISGKMKKYLFRFCLTLKRDREVGYFKTWVDTTKQGKQFLSFSLFSSSLSLSSNLSLSLSLSLSLFLTYEAIWESVSEIWVSPLTPLRSKNEARTKTFEEIRLFFSKSTALYQIALQLQRRFLLGLTEYI